MPILPRESDIFPTDLLGPGEGQEGDWTVPTESPWWALYTMSRREKELMRRLRAMEVPFYGPVIPQRTKSPSGRVRQSHVPLFTGYVFLYGDDEVRRAALETGCVSRSLPVPDVESLVADLRRVRQLIESGAPLEREQRLEPGRRVVVREGSLEGMEGIVIKRHGRTRLLIAVEFLQQGASMLLEDLVVEPLD